MSYGLAVGHYRTVFAGDSATFQQQSCTSGLRPICMNFFESSFAVEFGFVEVNGKVQTCRQRVDLFVQFMSVKWHTGFQTQCVSAAQSGGSQSSGASGGQQSFPDGNGLRGW